MSIQQMMLAAGGGIRHADATGGTVSYSGDWQIHTFTSSGTFAFTSYSGTPPVKFVIVNGGNTGVNGVKTGAFVVFFILVRAALARPRYDQLMSYGWLVMLPLSLLNLLITGAIVLSHGA